MRFVEHLPLDPGCPDNHLEDFLNDPMTVYYGMGSEMAPDIEARHRSQCSRCVEFGLENIEIVEG